MTRLNYDKAKRRKTEPAEPKGREPVPLRGGSHVKPGPVRQYTPEERRRLYEAMRQQSNREV